MAVFTRVKTWVSNEVLTASDLNGEFNNLLNNTIPASIEDYSADVSTMQSTTDPGGVGTESLATTLAGEIQRIRYAIKRIVGGAQWYTAPVFDLGSTVSTSEIADAAVTQAKRAALGQQISSSSATFNTASTTGVDVTNLTVTITTTGRPVFIGLIPFETGNPSQNSGISIARGSASAGAFISFLRGSTVIGVNELGFTATGASAIDCAMPVSAFNMIEVPAAGTYTYKVQARCSLSLSTLNVLYTKLIAYEL